MADNVIIIPGSEEIADEIEDTGDEIEALSEQIAAHSAASETRHTQILEGVETCRTRLETLSSAATSENPALIQISSQLVALQAELLTLRTLFMENRTPAPVVEVPLLPEPDLTEQPPVLEESADDPANIPIPEPASTRKTQRMA